MNRRFLVAGGLCLGLVTVGLIVTGIGGGGAIIGGGGPVVVIADTETGEAIETIPTEEGATIELEYTHSVEKTPITEVYEVRGERLVHTEMHFASYGAGLPSNEPIEREDDSFMIQPETTHETIHITPGEIAGHTLTIEGMTYDLVALSDGESVTLCAHSGVQQYPDRILDRGCRA